MSVQKAYDQWASQYDTNENKTRDLEARSLRETIGSLSVNTCLELGCGTGKNSAWLATQVTELFSVDLSAEMLARAREKVKESHVRFQQVNLLEEWDFVDKPYDLAVFSLVLEHIENLPAVFLQLARAIRPGGYVYIGELHPFKQYTGSKARFETTEGVEIVPCFDHHVSDFTGAAEAHGFQLVTLKEYFDEGTRTGLPRILTLLFKKN